MPTTEAHIRAGAARRNADAPLPRLTSTAACDVRETTLKELRRELALLRSYSLLEPPGRGLCRLQHAVPRL